MKVLESKARTISSALVSAGYASEASQEMICGIVYKQLRMGGEYDLIEDRTCIHVKSKECVIEPSIECR